MEKPEGRIHLPPEKYEEKKLTTTKSWGPGRKTIEAFYFFKLVGVAYETLGHHHTVINS